jgi:LmbE family N-acetylglucosaminyl deacetylase
MPNGKVVSQSPPVVVFLFAHQDDEYPINARIRFEVKRGAEVICLYLTDGEGRGVSSAVRNAESVGVLTSYGVAQASILFPGLELGIRDGHLMREVDSIAVVVAELLAPLSVRIEAIFIPAWEGGHPDHDAVHLIGLDAANSIGVSGKCWEYSLYNSYGTRHFFRVMKHLDRPGIVKRDLSFRESIVSAFQCWRYPSQLRTWLALFPESLFRWLVLRCERTARVDASWIDRRPHEGTLLYERLFNTSHEEFMELTAPIRRRILSARS